jgi:hypothetical protein
MAESLATREASLSFFTLLILGGFIVTRKSFSKALFGCIYKNFLGYWCTLNLGY